MVQYATTGCDLQWLLKVAIISRLVFLLLALFINIAFEDFDSSTMIQLKDVVHHQQNNSMALTGMATHYLLNGLNKWDSVYFNHIAANGYEYEQMLAFAPVFPYLAYFLSTHITSNVHLSSIQFISILVNFISHIVAVCILQLLTKKLLSRTPSKPSIRDSYVVITTLAFIFNPANIFMMSSYTESLFVVVQFTICLALECGYFKVAAFFVGISPLIRSNGLLNIIFLIYFYLKHIVHSNRLDRLGNIGECLKPSQFLHTIRSTYKQFIVLIVLLILSITPFVIWQCHIYNTFCTIGRIATSKDHWCNQAVPLSYSYVQSHYWNVGFLQYFRVSQLPNFLLATPICILVFLGVNRLATADSFLSVVKWLGFKDIVETQECFTTILKLSRTFVYACHISFLTVFGIFNVHVQILTRMLCSSSPFVYWTVAELLLNQNSSTPRFKKSRIIYFVFAYFILYNLLGLFLHTNFYPWT